MSHQLFRKTDFRAVLLSIAIAGSASAQATDTLFIPPKPLFTRGDAALVAGFTLAAIAAAPIDRTITQQLQDPARQANRFLNKGATIFRLLGEPGGLFTGGTIYAVGLAVGNRRAEDLGLHTVGSILVASTITGVIKITAGRARPRKSPDRAANFRLFRGLKDDEYRSFPSGHSTAAFAFASIVSAETSHWWPDSRWLIGPVVYGGAALTGASRIYNNAHWASDVIIGAAIGTLAGQKVYRYQHSHPGNRIDRMFLRAGVEISNRGNLMPILSMVPR